jgi:hypothetical protein
MDEAEIVWNIDDTALKKRTKSDLSDNVACFLCLIDHIGGANIN